MAVSRLDALATGTANNGTYSVSSGTNRLLVVTFCQEGDPLTADQVTCTYGGQSMTKQVTVITSDNKLELYIFTLDDDGIEAASNTTITFSGHNEIAWTASSYEGVDQTAPVPETNSDETTTTPNPLTGADITAGDGAAVVAAAGNGKLGVSCSWGSDLTEQADFEGSGSYFLSVADGLFASGQSVGVEATWDDLNRIAVVSAELAAADSPVSHITEGVVFGDTFTARATVLASIVEGLAIGDADVGQADTVAALTEGLAAGDVESAVATAAAALVEGLAAGDLETALASAQATLTEGTRLGDAFTALATAAATILEGIQLGDTYVGATSGGGAETGSVTEGVEFGEVFAALASTLASMSEGVTLSDVVTALATAVASIAEGILLGDSFSPQAATQAALVEGAVFGDAFSAVASAVASVTEGIRLGDTLLARAATAASIAEGISFGDEFATPSFQVLVATLNLFAALSGKVTTTETVTAEASAASVVVGKTTLRSKEE